MEIEVNFIPYIISWLIIIYGKNKQKLEYDANDRTNISLIALVLAAAAASSSPVAGVLVIRRRNLGILFACWDTTPWTHHLHTDLSRDRQTDRGKDRQTDIQTQTNGQRNVSIDDLSSCLCCWKYPRNDATNCLSWHTPLSVRLYVCLSVWLRLTNYANVQMSSYMVWSSTRSIPRLRKGENEEKLDKEKERE